LTIYNYIVFYRCDSEYGSLTYWPSRDCVAPTGWTDGDVEALNALKRCNVPAQPARWSVMCEWAKCWPGLRKRSNAPASGETGLMDECERWRRPYASPGVGVLAARGLPPGKITEFTLFTDFKWEEKRNLTTDGLRWTQMRAGRNNRCRCGMGDGQGRIYRNLHFLQLFCGREEVRIQGPEYELAGEPPALRGPPSPSYGAMKNLRNLHFFGFAIYDIRFTSERAECGLRRGGGATTFAARSNLDLASRATRPAISGLTAHGKEWHL
jgi:hypothetical protein